MSDQRLQHPGSRPIPLILSILLTLVVCLGMLRPLKGFLIASQFVNNAAPGQLKKP